MKRFIIRMSPVVSDVQVTLSVLWKAGSLSIENREKGICIILVTHAAVSMAMLRNF